MKEERLRKESKEESRKQRRKAAEAEENDLTVTADPAHLETPTKRRKSSKAEKAQKEPLPEQDDVAEATPSKKRSTKKESSKVKKRRKTDPADDKVKGGGLEGFKPQSGLPFVEHKTATYHTIHKQQLVAGSLVVGYVQSVTDTIIRVSLAQGIMGVVPPEHSMELPSVLSPEGSINARVPSQSMRERFSDHQRVIGAVLPGSEDKGSVTLSLRPSIVNAGLTLETLQPNMWLPVSVKSVEEKGFTASLGLIDLTRTVSSESQLRPINMTVFVHTSETESCQFPEDDAAVLLAYEQRFRSVAAGGQMDGVRGSFGAYKPLQRRLLKYGVIVAVRVVSIDYDNRVVHCGFGTRDAEASILPFDNPLDVKLLRAGMLVECKISKVLETRVKPTSSVEKIPGLPPRSLVVNFLNHLNGCVPLTHLYHPNNIPMDLPLDSAVKYPVPDFNSLAESGAKMTARIIAVIPGSALGTAKPTTYLSFLPHLISWSRPLPLWKPSSFSRHIGHKIADAVVTDWMPSIHVRLMGMMPQKIEVQNQPEDTKEDGKDPAAKIMVPVSLYARAQKARQDYTIRIEELFPISSAQPFRVTGFQPLENIFVGTLLKEEIDAQVLTSFDLKGGDLIKGIVVDVFARGLKVAISPTVTGFVYNAFLSDYSNDHTPHNFSSGMSGTFRVLYSCARRGVTLTAKKSMVEDPNPILKQSDLRVGMIGIGSVMRVEETGCWVAFYNDVRVRVLLQRKFGETLAVERGHLAKVKIIRFGGGGIAYGSFNLDAPIPGVIPPDGRETEDGTADANQRVAHVDREDDVTNEHSKKTGDASDAEEPLIAEEDAEGGSDLVADFANILRVHTKAGQTASTFRITSAASIAAKLLGLDDDDEVVLTTQTPPAGHIPQLALGVGYNNDGIFVAYISNRASGAASGTPGNVKMSLGFIPKTHLADDSKRVDDFFALLTDATSTLVSGLKPLKRLPALPPLAVLGRTQNLQESFPQMKITRSGAYMGTVLTAKRSIVDSVAESHNWSEVSDKSKSLVLPAFVTNITNDAITVCTGDLNRSFDVATSNAFPDLPNPQRAFTVGDTVVVYRDIKKQQGEWTLYPTSCSGDQLRSHARLVQSQMDLTGFLNSCACAKPMLPGSFSKDFTTEKTKGAPLPPDGVSEDVKLITPGSVVKCVPTSHASFGSVVSIKSVVLPSGNGEELREKYLKKPVTGMALHGRMCSQDGTPLDLTEVDFVEGIILEIDWTTKIADLLLDVRSVGKQKLALAAIGRSRITSFSSSEAGETPIKKSAVKTLKMGEDEVVRNLCSILVDKLSSRPERISSQFVLSKQTHCVVVTPLTLGFADGSSAEFQLILAGTSRFINESMVTPLTGVAVGSVKIDSGVNLSSQYPEYDRAYRPFVGFCECFFKAPIGGTCDTENSTKCINHPEEAPTPKKKSAEVTAETLTRKGKNKNQKHEDGAEVAEKVTVEKPTKKQKKQNEDVAMEVMDVETPTKKPKKRKEEVAVEEEVPETPAKKEKRRKRQKEEEVPDVVEEPTESPKKRKVSATPNDEMSAKPKETEQRRSSKNAPGKTFEIGRTCHMRVTGTSMDFITGVPLDSDQNSSSVVQFRLRAPLCPPPQHILKLVNSPVESQMPPTGEIAAWIPSENYQAGDELEVRVIGVDRHRQDPARGGATLIVWVTMRNEFLPLEVRPEDASVPYLSTDNVTEREPQKEIEKNKGEYIRMSAGVVYVGVITHIDRVSMKVFVSLPSGYHEVPDGEDLVLWKAHACVVDAYNASQSAEVIEHLADHFTVGQNVPVRYAPNFCVEKKMSTRAQIVPWNVTKEALDMCIVPKPQGALGLSVEGVKCPSPHVAHALSYALERAPPGRVVEARLDKVFPRSVVLHTFDSISIMVHLTDIDDNPNNCKPGELTIGSYMTVKILGPVARPSSAFQLAGTMRNSDIQGRPSQPEWRRPLTPDEVKIGDVFSGIVDGTNNVGCFVAVSRNLMVKITFRELTPGFIAPHHAQELFPSGRVIQKLQILSVEWPKASAKCLDPAVPKVERTIDLTNLFQAGGHVLCHPKSISKEGLKVEVVPPTATEDGQPKSEIEGVIRRDAVVDEYRMQHLVDSGEPIYAEVIKIAKAKNILMLKFVSGGDFVRDPPEANEDDGQPVSFFLDGDDPSCDSVGRVSDSDLEGEETDTSLQKKSRPPKKFSKVIPRRSATDWGFYLQPSNLKTSALDFEDDASETGRDKKGNQDDIDLDDLDGAEMAQGLNLNQSRKSAKRRKLENEKISEKEIARQEERILKEEWKTDPQTVEDFEKLILVNGMAAAVWIWYMAHYLGTSDIEQARTVAERAIKHLAFGHVNERFSLWVAYLNMECVFGTSETLGALLNRALVYNNPKKMLLHMTQIYAKNDQVKDAETTFSKLCAKFPKSFKVWRLRLEFHFNLAGKLSGQIAGTAVDMDGANVQTAEGRKLLQEAIRCLPPRKGVEITAHVARLEFRYCSAERGRALFEKVVTDHPKRLDLWNQYFDCVISANTPPRRATSQKTLQAVRSVFEKAATLSFRTFKMKSIYTRWLGFEKAFGNQESEEYVREKARNFVSSKENL